MAARAVDGADTVGTLCVVFEVALDVLLDDAAVVPGVLVAGELDDEPTETFVAAVGAVVGLVSREVGAGVLTMPTTYVGPGTAAGAGRTSR